MVQWDEMMDRLVKNQIINFSRASVLFIYYFNLKLLQVALNCMGVYYLHEVR